MKGSANGVGMEIFFKTDRFGGMEHRWRPKKSVQSIKDIVYHVRRVSPYGPDWELVKAISKKIVFQRGREKSVVTYEVKN